MAQAIAVGVTHVRLTAEPPSDNWLGEDFAGLRILVTWGRVGEPEKERSHGGILIRVAPLPHPARPRPEGGVDGGTRQGETRVEDYEGLDVGTLVVSIEGATLAYDLRDPARSSSLDNLLGLPRPCLLGGEAINREWWVDGQGYPIITASDKKLVIPAGHVGRVVLHDDRPEARLAASEDESEHRFLTTRDCWQLKAATPKANQR